MSVSTVTEKTTVEISVTKKIVLRKIQQYVEKKNSNANPPQNVFLMIKFATNSWIVMMNLMNPLIATLMSV